MYIITETLLKLELLYQKFLEQCCLSSNLLLFYFNTWPFHMKGTAYCLQLSYSFPQKLLWRVELNKCFCCLLLSNTLMYRIIIQLSPFQLSKESPVDSTYKNGVFLVSLGICHKTFLFCRSYSKIGQLRYMNNLQTSVSLEIQHFFLMNTECTDQN